MAEIEQPQITIDPGDDWGKYKVKPNSKSENDWSAYAVKKKVDTAASPSGSTSSVSGGGGFQNSPETTNEFTSKPDLYSPMMLTKAGRDDYNRNQSAYHPDVPPPAKGKGMSHPSIVAPIKTAPETFVYDQTKNPDIKNKEPDNTAYNAASDKAQKEHDAKDTGSWNNTLYQGSTALTQAVTKPVSALSKIMRDVIGKGTNKADAYGTDAREKLYNKDGSLTDYAISVEHGSIGDPLARLALGLDGYDQNTDIDRSKKKLPDTFLGNTTQGLIDIAPDIATTTLFPEAKIEEAGNAAFNMLKHAVNNPFTKVLAIKGGLNAYSQAEQKGDTPGEAVIESGKGAIKGLASGAEMSLAGGVGAKVTDGAFKGFVDAGLVKGDGILTKAGLRATADATIFAALPLGHAAITEGIDKLKGNPTDTDLWDNAMKEAQAGAGMGLGFALHGAYEDVKNHEDAKTHINDVLGDRQAIAMNNFMTATPDAIAEAFNSPIASGDMNAKAVEYAHKAQQEKDIDKKQQLITLAQTFAKSSDVKGAAEAILADKQGFIQGIENSELHDEDKKKLLDKIDQTHKALDPIEQQKTAMGSKITELDDAISKNQDRITTAGASGDPIEQADAEVVGDKLAKEKKSLEKDLRKVIAKQYEQKPEPLPKVAEEPLPEKPQANEAGKPEAVSEVPAEKPEDKVKAGDIIKEPKTENESPFKESKIQQTLYHGSDVADKKFRPTDKGIYFSEDKDYWPNKKYIYSAKIDAKNPEYGNTSFIEKTPTDNDSMVWSKKDALDFFKDIEDDATPEGKAKLERLKNIKDIYEAVVFHPDQIHVTGVEERKNEEQPKPVAEKDKVAEKQPIEPVKEEKTAIPSETAPSEKTEPVVKNKEAEKELKEINKQLSDADKDPKAYIPYSARIKLEKRRQELDDELNPKPVDRVIKAAGALPLPYTSEFIEHDIKPLVQKIATGTKEALSKIVKEISPKIGVATKDIDTITSNLNARNEEAANIDKVVNGYEKVFDKMKEPERVDFIDRIKRGLKQPTPELQDIADAYKAMDKDLYEQINSIKENLAFKEDHFRVLWKKIPGTEKTKSWFSKAKTPLEGSKGFLKKATLVDMSEGIAKGGDPVSTNPMTMFKIAHADAMKFITAHRMFDALKSDGVVKFYKSPSDVPENFDKIDDKIANVYFPIKTEAGGTIIHKAGEWYIEKNAGRIINNLLSRDKIRGTAIGDGLMAVKNITTSIELSLSPYHATAMSLEAMASDVARGLRKVINLGLRGDLKSATQGMADILKAPFSPKNTFSLGRKYIKLTSEKDFENSDFGKIFLRNNPLAKKYLHDMFMGGGLTKQDGAYKVDSFQSLKDNMAKDNYIGAAIRAIPAMNEMIMSPLFDTYIPSLKVGMFMKEFPLTLQENESRLQSGKVTRAELARKTVDFIDDRLGEMNFDNLFWKRSFKTATQLFFRSVTWKLGNARAIGGALPEQGMELYNAAKEGRPPILQPKVAWVLGLATVHATVTSLIQYGFTGTWPQNVKDLMYPRISKDNDKDRLALPDYGKDVSAIYYQGTGNYIKSALAGDVGKLYDLWKDKDFQGYNIIDPKDNVFDQGKDAVKYMMPQPIGVLQIQKDIKNKETIGKSVAHFIGFSPAPKYAVNTHIENKIYDLYNSHEGLKSKGQKEQYDVKEQIRELYKHGNVDGAEKLANESIERGLLKRTQINYLVSHLNSKTSPALYFFDKLPDDDKVYLYNEMTEAERKQFDPHGKVAKLAEKKETFEKKKTKPYSSFAN